MMNTAVTSDITRAISRPSKRSRTSAMVIVLGPATPIPCSSRPASIIGNDWASSASRQPAVNSANPRKAAGLRPAVSENGP
jgi:hypothetical protein